MVELKTGLRNPRFCTWLGAPQEWALPHSSPFQGAPRLGRAVRPRVRPGLQRPRRPVAVGTSEHHSTRRRSSERYQGQSMELPDPVRQRLGNFSRTVFSDSSRTGPEYNEGPGEWRSSQRRACGPRKTWREFWSGRILPRPKMAVSPSAGSPQCGKLLGGGARPRDGAEMGTRYPGPVTQPVPG